jgi:hypothetical protein
MSALEEYEEDRVNRLARVAVPLLGLFASSHGLAHGGVQPQPAAARVIEFPDTAEYKTLVLDLHTHSVFSDGHVWPTVRIGEAQRDGLDGVAITEHLEYQPHISDIPHPDRNRAFQEAQRAAKGLDLTVIPGVEITRLGDPGHINAVFVKDANPLVKQSRELGVLEEHMFETRVEAEDFAGSNSEQFRGAHQVEHNGRMVWMPYSDKETYLTLANFGYAASRKARAVVEAANDQGAFLFWNHPSFDTVNAKLNKFHTRTVKDGLLQGIEIANGKRYYKNAHRLALKHNLALIGVSDVHELIAWDYRPDAATNPGHRPVTLVLAEEDSLAGMRDALFARRTVVWWQDTLIGRPAHLLPLLSAIVEVADIRVESWGIRMTLRNKSDAPLLLQPMLQPTKRKGGGAQLSQHAQLIELAPHSKTEVPFRMDKPSKEVTFKFSVLNALVAPDKPATLELGGSE